MTREYDDYACGMGCHISSSTAHQSIVGSESGKVEYFPDKTYRVIDVEGRMYVDTITDIGKDENGTEYIVIDNKRVIVHSIIFIALE